MCDTMLALGKATIDGSTILAKNSDREADEPQHLVRIPGSDFLPGSICRTTYISIPQVKKTFEIFLSRPSWVWGGEMGVNECSVAIANEAVFTKEALQENGLLGMDLLRLGLERGETAREALHIVTSLLDEFGQGGSSGYRKKFNYHNSFIIADPKEAYILETAGKHWAAKKVESIASISNKLTIEKDFDFFSDKLISNAIEKGWCKKKSDFNFAKNYSSFIITKAARAKERQSASHCHLTEKFSKINPHSMMNFLRTHEDKKNWSPENSSMRSLCLHASGVLCPSQTTSSFVAHLHKDFPTYWFTGTSAPCISIFKPFYIPGNNRNIYQFEGDEINYTWYQHEKIHRRILKDYNKLAPTVQSSIKQIETEFIEQDSLLRKEKNYISKRELQKQFDNLSFQSNKLADAQEKKWYKLIPEIKQKGFHPLYSNFWKNKRFKALAKDELSKINIDFPLSPRNDE